jgi:hypothetical protein
MKKPLRQSKYINNKVYLLIIYSLIFIKCNKPYAPVFENTDEKLSILANFDNFNGLSILVSKAGAVTKPVLFKDLLIRDARVYLVDSVLNKSWIIPFDPNEEIYRDSSLIPMPDHDYKIKVSWGKYSIESRATLMPSIPEITILDKSIIYNSDTFYGGYNFDYSLQINDKDLDRNYISSGIGHRIGEPSRPSGFPDYVENSVICGYDGVILPDICFNGKSIKIKMNGSIVKNVSSKDYKGKYYIFINSISPSFYAYRLSLKEPDPLERYFVHPSITASDYPDAFGYFAILNINVIDSIIVK